MSIIDFAGRIYPAKSAKLELIDHLREIAGAAYQDNLRVSLPRRAVERAIADLEHGIQLFDALQDERNKNLKLEEAVAALMANDSRP